MSAPEFKLEKFEGPLDLLLSLIAKHKLDIYDIPISELLEQYLAYIEKMRVHDMDIASEFLEMASRLVYLKTIMLLPQHEEEAEVLKSELEGQLIEYGVCKIVAKTLGEQNVGGSIFVREPEKIELPKKYEGSMDIKELLSAYIAVAGKRERKMPPPASAFSEIVARRMVSIKSRVMIIMSKLLGNKKGVPIEEVWLENNDRFELVAAFLAVLELIRHERIVVTDDGKRLRYNSKGGDKSWELENIEEQ